MKSATSKKTDRKNQLTPADAKEIHTLLASIIGAFDGESITPADKRYLKKVAAIAGKVRRLY